MTIVALFIGNAVIGLSAPCMAQYQGFVDVQMGIGMLVWGVASVVLGESLVGSRKIGLLITGAVMGSVLFRLLVAVALRFGLNPNDLKLITAAFVFVALIFPAFVSRVLAPGAEERACLRLPTSRRRFTPARPTKSAPAGREPDDRTQLVRVRDRHQRLRQVDPAECRGRDVSHRFRTDFPQRHRHHPLARAPPGETHRPRVSGPVQRHGPLDDDCGKPGAGGAARTAAGAAVCPFDSSPRRAARPRGGDGAQSRGPAEQPDRHALRRAAAVAHAVDGRADEAGVLLLDEHTAALDPKSADQVIRLTQEFISRDKLTTLMVTHSMQQAASLGDRVIMMDRGRVAFDISGQAKRRLRPEDLLSRFEELRRANQLDESAAEMLRRQYV